MNEIEQPSPPTISVAVFCASTSELAGIEETLVSIAEQEVTALSTVIVADRNLHPELRTLRQPPGLGVGLAATAPPFDADYVCLIRSGGFLLPDALRRVTRHLEQYPTTELIYADDGLRPAGAATGTIISDPILRPGFSPERLLCQMYLGEFVVVSTATAARAMESSLAAELGCRWGSPLPHGTALVLAHGARRIGHIPDPLYLRSAAVVEPDEIDIPDVEAQVRAVSRFMELTGINGVADAVHEPTAQTSVIETDQVLALQPRLRSTPLVSIIIPTIGTSALIDGRPTRLVDQAISSIQRASTYSRYEIVVVLGQKRPEGLEQELARRFGDVPTRIVTDDRPFNFSHACNLGVVASDGDYVVLVNDDVRVLDPLWIERMLMHATNPRVGAVGTRLLYPDLTVQHAGIWSRGGHPVHRYEGYGQEEKGANQSLRVTQNALAVTGACLMVARHKFDHVGGLSPVFPSSYNDVDLCLKLLDVGWRTVVVPQPAMIHYEASTRDPIITAEEMELLHDRWRYVLNHDPYDNPNHRAELSEELPVPWIVIRSAKPYPDRSWPLPSSNVDQLELDEVARRRAAKHSASIGNDR